MHARQRVAVYLGRVPHDGIEHQQQAEEVEPPGEAPDLLIVDGLEQRLSLIHI